MLVWPRRADAGQSLSWEVWAWYDYELGFNQNQMHEMRSICAGGQLDHICGQFWVEIWDNITAQNKEESVDAKLDWCSEIKQMNENLKLWR